MNIYEVATIEKEIDRIASENDGEIPEELLQKLVEAQTSSIESVDKLCGYIRYLQIKQKQADDEIKRITRIKAIAENRERDVKKFMAPFIKANKKKGKSLSVGLFSLGLLVSKKVDLDEGFNNPLYGETVTTTEFKPDKKKIREAIEAGEIIPGARLPEVDNVQVKL